MAKEINNNEMSKKAEINQQKNFTAKKYFLYAFRKQVLNENKALYKKFLPSLREVILDYIDVYEDINQNIENQKLENAKKDILNSSIFFMKENIFYKKGIYKEELDLLIKDMEDIAKGSLKSVDEVRIYNKCRAMVKKISGDNIYKHLANIIKNLSSFSDVDRTIDCIISEMLYDDYSLQYIGTWYKENIFDHLSDLTNEKMDILIDNFKKFKISEKGYKYYLTIKLGKKKLSEKIYLDHHLVLTEEQMNEVVLLNSKDNKDAKNYLQFSEFSPAYSVVVNARDYHKGLEILIDSLNSYFQMIKYSNEDGELGVNDKIVVEVSEQNYKKIRNEVADDKILFNKSEKREIEDIKDFIEYRDKVYSMNIGYDEISNIQRAINIVKGQKKQTKENRLINLWSVLEYMLTFHNGNSIIAKVKDIVPKVHCLYLIKDKLNTFWNILYQYKDSNYEGVQNMIESCRANESEYRYDLNKLIAYIQNRGKDIAQEFEFNEILKKSILEIGGLLFQKNERRNFVEKTYKEIEMDLIRIYRDRNLLIHSGRREIRNINYKTLRLYQYNNNILSVIIYYKKKNPTLTIEEILNSIEYTYNKYSEKIKTDIKIEELQEICRPKYLFIE